MVALKELTVDSVPQVEEARLRRTNGPVVAGEFRQSKDNLSQSTTKSEYSPQNLKKELDLESIIAFVRSDCPFPIPENAQIKLNLRKLVDESGNYTGVIEAGNFIIKFSTDQRLLKEIGRNKSLNKIFRKNNISAKIPQIFVHQEGKTSRASDSPIVYVKFRKIQETDPTIRPILHARAILKIIRGFEKIPSSDLENLDLERKEKQDYLKDIVDFFDKIDLPEIEGIDSKKFSEYQKIVLDLFAVNSNYDLAQRLTHSDLALHNMFTSGAGRVTLIDWEDVLEGCPWEDYARILFDLITHPVVDESLSDELVKFNESRKSDLAENSMKKSSFDKSTAELFWEELSDMEKYHTMQFIIYKSLYLLDHHNSHFKTKPTEERKSKVKRNLNAFFIAVDYCQAHPYPGPQSKDFPFQDVNLTSTSQDIRP